MNIEYVKVGQIYCLTEDSAYKNMLFKPLRANQSSDRFIDCEVIKSDFNIARILSIPTVWFTSGYAIIYKDIWDTLEEMLESNG